MGAVENVFWSTQGMSFENILKKLEGKLINDGLFLVGDLNHLVKGSRLSMVRRF